VSRKNQVFFCSGYEFTGLEEKNNNINGHKLRTLTRNKRGPNWNNIKSSVIIFFFLILKVKNLNLNEDSFASSFFPMHNCKGQKHKIFHCCTDCCTHHNASY
jgi:hypothetical protein